MINPWKVLGVHRKSTDEEIREAFVARVKKVHPDRKNGGDRNKFLIVNEAYQLIKSKTARHFLLEHRLYMADKCAECHGVGVKSKSQGFSNKLYTACNICGGAGVIISVKAEEDVIIELPKEPTSKRRK